LSGHPWLRSICVDSLFYNGDGTIQMVKQTREHGTPYTALPHAIPGTIEAEDFDQGGQGKGYSDSEGINNGNAYRELAGVDIEMNSPGSYNVGWTNGGEWLEYTVDVKESSRYTFKTMAASPNNTSSFRFKIDGNDVASSVMLPNTGGWQNYRAVSTAGINLEAGTHILQLFEETGGFNIDKIILAKEETVMDIAPIERHAAFSVYPNPVHTELTIESSEQDPVILSVAIFDLKGQLIEKFSNAAKAKAISLNVSKINSGCYVLKVYSGKAVHARKLIIKGTNN
jgi:arabinoxylan arabinofuranohydrolase